MGEGLTTELGLAGLCVGIACLWIALRDLPLNAALLVTLIRVSIPVAYFAWYFNGTWGIHDDLNYFEGGLDLLDAGDTPLSLLFGEGYDRLVYVANSRHTLYYWWNLLALTLFGEHYYAPVLMNVVATFVGAHLFAKMLRHLGFGRSYRRWAQVFMLLHWEIITWTFSLNIKDPMVYVLTIAALASAVQFYQTRAIRPLAAFLIVCGVFQTVRFYVPVLMIGAIAIWMASHWKSAFKYLLLLLIGALSVYAMSLFGDTFREYLSGSFFYGFGRFILQPLPWKLSDSTSYLLISSTLHIAFFLPALLGAIVLWRESSVARLVIIYLVIVVCFYAAGEGLQGPRHRVQISFIFAWIQFHFLWRAQSRSEIPTPLRKESTRIDSSHQPRRPRRAVMPSSTEANAHA